MARVTPSGITTQTTTFLRLLQRLPEGSARIPEICHAMHLQQAAQGALLKPVAKSTNFGNTIRTGQAVGGLPVA